MATFTLFPKLPPEIRLRIWTYAQPDSRIVRVMNLEEDDYLDFYKDCCNGPTTDCRCLDHHDPLLLASKESRYEYLKTYSQVPIADKLAKTSKHSRTFFDPRKDIFMLDNHLCGYFDIFLSICPMHMISTLPQKDSRSRFANSIRVAALPFPKEVLSDEGPWRLDAYITILAFNCPSLEEIIFTLGSPTLIPGLESRPRSSFELKDIESGTGIDETRLVTASLIEGSFFRLKEFLSRYNLTRFQIQVLTFDGEFTFSKSDYPASAEQLLNLLAACKESREVVLKDWLPPLPYSFTESPKQPSITSHIATAYFNPSIDTIYMDDYLRRLSFSALLEGLVTLLSVPALQKLRSLACHEALYAPIQEQLEQIVAVLLMFKHLKPLTTVEGDPGWFQHPSTNDCKGIIHLQDHETDCSAVDEIKSVVLAELKKGQSLRCIAIEGREIWEGEMLMSEEAVRRLIPPSPTTPVYSPN
ncbi:uncharacterized protein PAC_17115 [Phialocephala subalpina]|uniref:2EXR domain-containing protein n=1 Tax=Phialocephala subalpina TaxID=576137 RepID=A0A1L7XQ98_9HELO|nr:uncharacterized protein PAC_17115 [Phialocephala subalpina]